MVDVEPYNDERLPVKTTLLQNQWYGTRAAALERLPVKTTLLQNATTALGIMQESDY